MTVPVSLPVVPGRTQAFGFTQPSDGSVSVAGAFDALWRHRLSVVCGAIMGLSGALVMLLAGPQFWAASTDIELSPHALPPGNGPRVDIAAGLSDAAVENQGVMALSRPVLLRAAHMLAGQPELRQTDRDPAVALQHHLTVRRLPRTMVWRISATGPSAVAAARIANSTARSWVEEHRQLRIDAAARLAALIEARLPALSNCGRPKTPPPCGAGGTPSSLAATPQAQASPKNSSPA